MSGADGSGAGREKPVMPTAEEAAAAGQARTDAPGVVRAAFWVWVAAGVVGVMGAVLFFALRDELIAAAVQERPDLDAAELESGTRGLTWLLLLGSVSFLGFFVLLAHKARRGVRKARTLLVVLGVFAALFQYTIGRVGLLGLVSALLIVVAVGLLYAPAARRFFAESAESAEAR